MTDTEQADQVSSAGEHMTASPPAGMSRMQLIWQVLVFQVKLAADGLRDLILVPVSLLAALLGLLSSRDDPAKYYRQILNLGRRSEYWINLFGYRKGQGTADEMIKGLEERVFAEAENNPHLRRANETLNRSIDSVSGTIEKRFTGKETPPPD